MTTSDAELLDCVVTETGPSPEHVIIWLHGLGADGNDFAPIVPQLGAARSRAVRFVFPHAPVRPVTVNGGMAMRAWYDIAGVDIARDQDTDGIHASLVDVERLIEAELARGIEADRLVLAGFSQGGAIALRAGLARSSKPAGVVALSCYLLESDGIDRWMGPAASSTPVFMAHGLQDPVVPIQLGRDSARVLAEQHVPVEWSEWPMPHAVCPDEIVALDRWLEARFGE
jgi:phospholipase/carboxylesterase